MSLRDDNLRFALLKALADIVDEELKSQRAGHAQVLFQAYDDSRSTSFDVLLPGGRQAATISLTGIGQAYVVDNEAAFLDWASEHQPQMVKETVVPPQPEQRFREVNASAKTAMLKRLQVDDEGRIYDPKTGLTPDGVSRSGPGQPTGFQIRFTANGRGELVRAYQGGALNQILGAALPELEPAEMDTPPLEEQL